MLHRVAKEVDSIGLQMSYRHPAAVHCKLTCLLADGEKALHFQIIRSDLGCDCVVRELVFQYIF